MVPRTPSSRGTDLSECHVGLSQFIFVGILKDLTGNDGAGSSDVSAVDIKSENI